MRDEQLLKIQSDVTARYAALGIDVVNTLTFRLDRDAPQYVSTHFTFLPSRQTLEAPELALPEGEAGVAAARSSAGNVCFRHLGIAFGRLDEVLKLLAYDHLSERGGATLGSLLSRHRPDLEKQHPTLLLFAPDGRLIGCAYAWHEDFGRAELADFVGLGAEEVFYHFAGVHTPDGGFRRQSERGEQPRENLLLWHPQVWDAHIFFNSDPAGVPLAGITTKRADLQRDPHVNDAASQSVVDEVFCPHGLDLEHGFGYPE